MIAVIETTQEYGKQGTVGINQMSELDEKSSLAYAHNVEEAVAWLKSHKLFANVESYSLGDGRLVFESAWMENSTFDSLFVGYEGVTHTRQKVVIHPVNTVYESTGYKSPAVFSLE